jgi:hypothetical protein
MTAARRIAQHRPPRAHPVRVAEVRRARRRAPGAAMLGAVAGLALGAAILIGAPGAGAGSRTGGARFDRPAAPSPGWAPVSVASVIAPAPGAEASPARDREAGHP